MEPNMSAGACRTLMLLGMCLLLSGQARVFRCEEASGAIRFSDVPCARGEAEAEYAVKPNTVDTSGAREQILKRQVQSLQEQLQQQQQQQQASQPAVIGRTQPDLQAERIDTAACEQATRAYEIEAGSMLSDKASVEMKRAAMYGACGMREPDKVEINVNNNNFDRGYRHDRPRLPPRPPREVVPHNPNPGIARCDGSGCWGSDGQRYERASGNTYYGPNGPCQRAGSLLRCP